MWRTVATSKPQNTITKPMTKQEAVDAITAYAVAQLLLYSESTRSYTVGAARSFLSCPHENMHFGARIMAYNGKPALFFNCFTCSGCAAISPDGTVLSATF